MLLSCLNHQISAKVQQIITEFAKVLSAECEGGPTYLNLSDQISQLMTVILPAVKNQKPEIVKIIDNKNFNHIY